MLFAIDGYVGVSVVLPALIMPTAKTTRLVSAVAILVVYLASWHLPEPLVSIWIVVILMIRWSPSIGDFLGTWA